MNKRIKKFTARIVCLAVLMILLCAGSVFAYEQNLPLTATSNSDNSVSLSWDSPKKTFGTYYTADKYTVQRKTPTDADWITIGTPAGNTYSYSFSYKDTEPPFSEGVEYRVLATVRHRSDTSIAPVDVVSNVETIDANILKTPSIWTADGGPNAIEPRWSEVNGAAGYEVYSVDDAGNYNLLATIEDPTVTSWKHTGLKDVTVYYSIRSFGDTNGVRYYSAFSKAFPGGTNGVEYTISVKKNAYGNVVISWYDPEESFDIDGDYDFETVDFTLYKKSTSNPNWTSIYTVTADQYDEEYSYTDKNISYKGTTSYKLVVNGKTFFWGDDYEFYWDTESPVKSIKGTKAKAPTLKVSSTANSTSLKLSWNKVNGATGYKIYAANSKNGTYKLVKTIKSSKTTSWTHTKLKTGQTKHYKIKSYSGKSTSDYSNRVSKKVTKNQKTWSPSKSFDNYGGPNLRDKSVSYSNGKLQYKALVLNDRIFYASKFNWIRITIYADGKLIGSQKFYNKYIGLDAYDYKYMTFTLNKGTKKVVDLRNAGIDVQWEYNYNYTY